MSKRAGACHFKLVLHCPNVRALVTASADILADICYTRQRKARQVLGECSFTMRPLREKGYRCEHRSRI